MGHGTYTADAWSNYAAASGVKTKPVHQIYSDHLNAALDPKQIKNGFREARDNTDHPVTTPLIAALDVTGSMSSVLDTMAKQGMNTLVQEVYDRQPLPDPAIMCMAIGDAERGDLAPLQVTQFEADIRIQEQLAQLYLEGGGGGNAYESYLLPLYFAATKTKTDAWEKRSKKGYLFTIGDEGPCPYLRAEDVKRVLGDTIERDLTAAEVLTMASRQWEIFHVVVMDSNGYRSYGRDFYKEWTDLLGENAIPLRDHTKLAEVIVSTIQVREGASVDAVADSWSGATGLIVREAMKSMATAGKSNTGIITL